MTRKEQKLTQALECLRQALRLTDESPTAAKAVQDAIAPVERALTLSKTRPSNHTPAHINMIRVAVLDDIGAEYEVRKLTDPCRQMARSAAKQLIEEIDDYEDEIAKAEVAEAKPSIADCTCYHGCDEDDDEDHPDDAAGCSLAGDFHQHADDPCPVHPGAPMAG